MNNKIVIFFVRILYSALIPIVSIIHTLLNRDRGRVFDVSCIIDRYMNFNELFVLPYLYWFGYVFLGLALLAYWSPRNYFKLLSGIILGMFMCFVVYYFFPTMVPRPDVTGNGYLFDLVRLVYSMDNPYNCFPSIHVLNALLVTIYLVKAFKSQIIRIIAYFSFITITLSTVYIKQHYFLDAVASSVISILVVWLIEKQGIWMKAEMRKAMNAIVPNIISGEYDDREGIDEKSGL